MSHVLKWVSFCMTANGTKCSRGTCQQIKTLPLLCFNRELCLSLSLALSVCMCVNCWLLSSQQLYVGMCVLCFGAHRPVEVAVCVNALSPLVLSMRVYTRWHSFTHYSICAHPGDTLYPTPLCVYWADAQFTLTSCACICRGEPCFCLSP